MRKEISRYRKRKFRERRENRVFGSKEQRVCDQTRAIRKNSWLSELELEAIKKQQECESHDELWREQDVAVDAETVVIEAGTVEEQINDAEDQVIVEQLKKIMVRGRTCNGIMFKKVTESF